MKQGKRIQFGGKPTVHSLSANADDWVAAREAAPREPTKRFTIDVPIGLHKRVKSQCALGNLVMADVMRELLERRFPEHVTSDGRGEGSRGYD